MFLRKISYYVQRLILGAILASAAFFLLNAARGDSAIFDETAHIVAGYNYVHNLDYRFNPEHPPLIKMLAALPLAFQNLNFSKDEGYWSGLNEQWWAGNAFLYKSGNDADRIIFWARLGPILVTLLLILLTSVFALETVGRWWALLPAFLTGFSPIILAHGHYVTTDTGAAFGIMLSLYYFVRYAMDQSRKNLIYAGLAFGVAQSIKFSSVLLIPLFIFLLGALYASDLAQHWALIVPEMRWKKIRNYLQRYAVSFLGIIIVGYVAVVYPLYRYATWNYPAAKQVADTEAILQNFNFQPAANAAIWMAGNPALRPFAEYLLGVLMVFQRQSGGNNAFFLGTLSSHGWHYYFPLAYLMKESLPVLVILFVALGLGMWRFALALRGPARDIFRKCTEYVNVQFIDFTMLSFVVLYWSSSIASPLNIGVRHILPTIPFFYILAAGALKKWFSAQPAQIAITPLENLVNTAHAIFSVWLKSLLIGVLAIWLIGEMVMASPFFLSYFNEFSGGRSDGFRYITDSNFDWGQDLRRLQEWTDKNIPAEDKIAVDYFGGGDAQYYLDGRFVPWSSAKGNPKDEGMRWLAVSVNILQGAKAVLAPDLQRNPTDEYVWLENPYQPFARAGTSIFIYKL